MPPRSHPPHPDAPPAFRLVALVQLNRPDEAAHVGSLSVASKWLVPSNQWRAVELDRALSTRFGNVTEVQAFHERVEFMRRGTEPDSP